ncbi:FtsK/SpoIIIE family protein [Leuconostoc suionicum]|uniref:FtsK/SpoIIIE family protein n=1 Tax=Leuconostoc suionicum TaxID=1511761 RepID=A0A2N9K9H2_9LACO|nr:cell division protein FtsK [Leuconostoc suionicum]SPD91460.1 FtsK/SpoIIIE family protein [Leuconostoc suionicum]SPE06685.1 FtsK/SpoIIIE family protein [Leuconostoc suionicum]SPH03192.1 FtsK/SpoIIIE family protein [Leuconostoc suionicum]
MFKKIKYSDQYLAKTLFKRTLLLNLFLVTICFGFWYLNIFQSLMQGKYSWWYLSPIVLSILLTGLVGWGVFWFYKHYAPEHSDFISKYLKTVELRQMISLLIVSKGFFDTASDDNGTFIDYFPNLKLKVLHKTGQLILQEPVDGQKYMESFSKNEFDNVVETALLADRQTTEFSKNKMISTFAFDPIKFRRQLEELKPKKGLLQISKGIDWKYDTFYNALLSGNVGTGKSYTMFAIIGQLLQVTKFVYLIDPKRSDLAGLKHVPELKNNVFSVASEINQAVIDFYTKMMARAEKIEAIKASGQVGTYKDFGFTPYFLVFDEFGAYYEMNDRLAYDDPTKASYDTAMSNLREIAMLGRELGFYILIGMQRPDAGTLPMAIRNQLNMRINMGVPTPEIEKMVFPDNEKQLRPLSSSLKGWGFIKIGDSQVRSFFAPEVPKDFNLHEYMRETIAIRESQGK